MKALLHLFPLQIQNSGCAPAAGWKLAEGRGQVEGNEGRDEGKQQSDFRLHTSGFRALCQIREQGDLPEQTTGISQIPQCHDLPRTPVGASCSGTEKVPEGSFGDSK